MKKIFSLVILSITFCFCLTNVKADDTYFFWHNSMDNAYTTTYDGMISTEGGKYQNGTIESLGGHNIKINNFNAYDVIVTSASTWNLNGNNTINAIEESDNSVITITGTGSLKFKTIGLSMTDMLDVKTENLESRIKTYLKGDYNLSVEGQYITIKLNSKKEDNEVKKENSVTDKNNNKDEVKNNSITNENSNKVEESKQEQKELNFENKEFGIFIESPSKIPLNTIFIAKDLTIDRKEEITKKLNDNEKVKFVYDLTLSNNKEKIEPNQDVEVKIKLEEAKYNVYYYNDNKDLEKITCQYQDGYLVFKTSHFSEYIITEINGIKNNNISEPNDNNKNNIFVVCLVASVVVIIGIVSFVILKKKYIVKKVNKK